MLISDYHTLNEDKMIIYRQSTLEVWHTSQMPACGCLGPVATGQIRPNAAICYSHNRTSRKLSYILRRCHWLHNTRSAINAHLSEVFQGI